MKNLSGLVNPLRCLIIFTLGNGLFTTYLSVELYRVGGSDFAIAVLLASLSVIPHSVTRSIAPRFDQPFFLALICASLYASMIWRRNRLAASTGADKQSYLPMAQNMPIASELDPRTD